MRKVILISGASSGFGKLTAEKLLQQGHVVYAAARRFELMDGLKSNGAHSLRMDVADDESVRVGVAQVIDAEGRIDVLVNNAGYAAYGTVECTDLRIAQRQFEVNVFGAARLIQTVLPQMRAQNSGHIINVSSVVGKVAPPLMAWYSGSKHALEALSDALRTEVAAFGVDVSIIEPGAFKTDFDQVALKQFDAIEHDPAYADNVTRFRASFIKMYENSPTPEPVVAAIVSAIASKRPKTRYPVGGARLAFMAKALLSDKMFDKMIKSRMGVR